jgi:4-alpha-glucanotransferase
MTPPLRFCFALHVHQPWGNFDSVFEQHLREVYRPLLHSLIDGEFWPAAIHLSGPLLEWLDDHAPDFVDEIGTHAAAGRLEILCAGHDEPILAVLSRQDRLEQVLRHREWIRRRFGVEARGLWLTERVWEPTLPGELARAGVDFVLVDDRHFRVTGFAEAELHAHFVTEASGHRLNVFPIDEKLRYLIPFRPPSELAAYLRSLRDDGHQIAVLGDDGEKFGGWPGTRKWLYDDGWLESFLGTMRELRDKGEVHLSRFDDALAATPSGGLAYLPSASYREMEGWSLPFEPARALLRLEQAWDGPRLQGVEGGLLRGGHWRHFLVKYPESNRMHKMAMALSMLCRERGDPAEVRQAIGRAQCNDAYWHGVFGGFYLAFLRGAIWQNLARAEAALRVGEALAIERRDIDADGHDELWIHSAALSILAAPARGGMIETWLDLTTHENLLNTVARHREAYHEPLGVPDQGEEHQHDDAGAPSIHDLESQLTEIPPVDREPRGLFVDRIIAVDTSCEDFVQGRVTILHSWCGRAMASETSIADDLALIHFTADGLTKELRIGASAMACEWHWDSQRFPADAWFTTELSYSGDLVIDAPGAMRWDYEIETMAKSEKGFERATQGHATVLRWLAVSGNATVRVSVAR